MLRSTLCALLCASLVACAASPDASLGGGAASAGAGGVGGGGNVGGVGGTGGNSGTGGGAGTNASDASTGSLTANIVEPPGAMAISLVTIACNDTCATVQAVAEGGNPGYTFVWNDGLTSATREVCPDVDTTFMVTVSDTPISEGEFQYAGQSVTRSVTALVLACGSDAGVDGGDVIPLCAGGVTPAFQLMARAPTLLSSAYQQTNGTIADYETSDTFAPLVIVSQASLPVDIGACTKLLLAGDANGTVNVGWDNVLIVEYRQVPGGPVMNRWYYGAASNLRYVPTGQTLPLPMPPTVSGLLLDPSVPNPAPFGYAPRVIDLMDHVPDGVTRFEITLYVADYGGWGSTTEIWAIPE